MMKFMKKSSNSEPSVDSGKIENRSSFTSEPYDPHPEGHNDTNDSVQSPTSIDPGEEGEARPDLDEQLDLLELETVSEDSPSGSLDIRLSEETGRVDSAQAKSPKTSKLNAAFGEVRQFAGGLVKHPYEATKHYSVLRHSSAVVFYQGPTTSVAITVFSDQPLPPDRRLWLQKRGFSGKAGLKIGSTLGTRSAWIDVTPATDASPDMLPAMDERAWQRDIDRFLTKSKKRKPIRNHEPCETDIVRIPHVAEDGYFRIVLCSGRKVLCPSPMFRYASSSLNPSHFRGASLATLPLELGIKIGVIAAKSSANIATYGMLQPAITTYQNTAQPVMKKVNPLGLTHYAAQAAYEHEAGRMDEIYYRNHANADTLSLGDSDGDLMLIGSDEGPRSPFPIKFSGMVTRGSGKTYQRLGVPTANLINVPEDTLFRLSGTYIGWATVSKTKLSKSSSMPEDAYDTWYQALITVSPIRDQKASVVEMKGIAVYLMHDFGDAVLYDARLNVMLMALLHLSSLVASDNSEALETEQMRLAADIAIARASLDRPAWSPESTLEHIKSNSSSRSFMERITDARSLGQRQVDKVPLHRLGIRMEGMGVKDRLIGKGGICVKR